jgi:hemolysin activation/secretion protein
MYMQWSRACSILVRCCAASALSWILHAEAQVTGPDLQILRQEQREQSLRQQAEPEPHVPSEIPKPVAVRLPPDERPCQVIHGLSLRGDLANRFQWSLNAADTDDDPALGRCLGAQGIAIVMQRVQQTILARGYVTTRVLAEPQDLRNGKLVLTLVPGRVRQLRLADDSHPRAQLGNAMPVDEGDLLNLRALEQGLENLKRLPTADAEMQIQASEAAGAQPGDSDVIVRWQQRLPYRLNLSVDDSGTEYTGRYQGAVTFSYDHWWTLNDLFYLSYSDTLGGSLPGPRGSRSGTLHYSLPYRDWLLGFTASEFHFYQSIAGLNALIRYSGEGTTQDLALSRLLYRDGVRKTQATLRAWLRESRNFIDDAELTGQHRRTAGWEASLSHRERVAEGSLDASFAWRRGTGAFGAQRAPEEAFGEGSSRLEVARADAVLSLPFSAAQQHWRYSLGWRAQWNRTPLTPQDRFAIGNRYTLRGFDGESLLMGDRGWLLRQDLSWSVGAIRSEIYLGIDAGEVGGRSAATLPGTRLAGSVLGARGALGNLSWDVFIGRPLHKPEGFRTASTTTGFLLSLSL